MWVLVEQNESGKSVYFKGWDYAPLTTENVREAHTFESKEAAKDSAAYKFRGSSFVPVEVQLVVKSKAA